MNEEDYIQNQESQQQVNQQDWRDGSGGDNNLPNNSNPNDIPTLPNEDIPQLSEEETTKLNEWRNSKEFQIGLEQIKSESLLNNQDPTSNQEQDWITPPEKVKKIAQDLQKAFKGFDIYIIWDKTYEKQVHKALDKISTKEEFNQVVEYYNGHFAQDPNIPSLKEDLYQELKDTPKDFLKALATYNDLSEDTLDLTKDENPDDIGLDATNMEGSIDEVVIYAFPPPIVNLRSNQEIALDGSIKRKINNTEEQEWECDVFIESPSGKAKSTTVDKSSLTYKYKANEVGTHRVVFAYKENPSTEVETHEATFKVLSPEEYGEKAMAEENNPLEYNELQQKITIQEFLASQEATNDELSEGQGFYIRSDKSNPLNVEEDYENGQAILGNNEVNFRIIDSDSSSVSEYKWYLQMTPEEGVDYNGNLEEVGDNTRFELKGDFGSQTIVGQDVGMSDIYYYIICEALNEQGEVIKKAAYKHVEMIAQTYKQYEAVKNYNESIDQEEADLTASVENFSTDQLLLIKAIHITQANGEITSANIYILPIETNSGMNYKILDFSPNPAATKRRDYKTSDSIDGALKDFENRNHYPKGTLKLEVPQHLIQDDKSNQYDINTKGKSDMKAVSDGLATGSIIMGVLGTVMKGFPIKI